MNKGERPPKRGKKTYWSYIAGRRRVNRVRVYQDRPNGVIRIQWFAPRPRREVLRSPVTRRPIFDTELAMKAADFAAAKLLEKHDAATAAELFGHPAPRTFGELLTEYHAAKEHRPGEAEGPKDRRWGERHTRDQREHRKFWLAVFPATTPLASVTATKVEDAVEKAAGKNGWGARSQQKRLRYIVDAVGYAQVKLKWITEDRNLSAVSIPRPDSQGVEYSMEEAAALLDVMPLVDLRCAAAGEIAFCSGSRIETIRLIRAEHVVFVMVGERRVCVIDIAHDKTRRRRRIVLNASAQVVVERLLEEKVVQESGWLFASHRSDKPVSAKYLLDWLHDAERVAGVGTVTGRAYHGFKRTFATADIDLEALSRQTGTAQQTLAGVYRKELLAPKLRAADEIERFRRATSTVTRTGAPVDPPPDAA